MDVILKASVNMEEEINLTDNVWEGFLGEGLLSLLFFFTKVGFDLAGTQELEGHLGAEEQLEWYYRDSPVRSHQLIKEI